MKKPVALILTLVLAFGLVVGVAQSAPERPPLPGPNPAEPLPEPPPWARPNGTVDESKLPLSVPLLDERGNVVGEVDTAELFGPPPLPPLPTDGG